MFASQELRQELRQETVILGVSQHAQKMRDFARRVAEISDTILLCGETGAGKDHLAEYIHYTNCPKQNFVTVDCGTLTENLAESELFGYNKGAFTDAKESKKGLIQCAKGGILFFNEIANMSLNIQGKFLRIVEKKGFRPVGSTTEVPINTRIIAATNINLEKAVKDGSFRHDLYQRLNVISFNVPPLRERIEDIPTLSQHFLQIRHPLKIFSKDATMAMMNYTWPGNVRELGSVVARAGFCALDIEKEEIGPEYIVPYLQGKRNAPLGANAFANMAGDGLPKLKPFLMIQELFYLKKVLEETRGNISKAAKFAGISRTSFYGKIKKYSLQ